MTMQPQATILVVDDRESSRRLLKEMLESAGHRVLCAHDGTQGIELALGTKPDAIVLDAKMPGFDGFEVCLKLGGLAETATIPIVFVTADYTEEQDVLHGLAIGAYDYLVKPLSRSLLLARVAVVLRIRRSEERVRQLAMIDEFTGLLSRNYMVRRLGEDIRYAERYESPLTVTILDLDDFKTCNATFGHQFGDGIVKRVSDTLRASVRTDDSLGRYGGDEFLVVQPRLAESEALTVAERWRAKIAEECGYGEGRDLRLTLSAGIAEWDRCLGADGLIHRAERALFAAKCAGKNRALCYAELNGASTSAALARRSSSRDEDLVTK
jgi:diguanylate cyclase (GGDEF)-like protein